MFSFPQRAGNLLRRTKSRPLAPWEGRSILDPEIFTLPPFSVLPVLEAVVVSQRSPAYEEARALLAQRFARAAMPGAHAYLETVDFAPERTVPLVVRRKETGVVVGTACLELPSNKSFVTSVQFLPGSVGAEVAAQGTFAEIRGFATRFDLDWVEVHDLIDTLAYAVVHLAKRLNLEWLWVQPRFSAMSLFLADIPGLLPPYRFVRCRDVVGWHVDSPAFAELLALRLKELPISPESLPVIYQIKPAELMEDMNARLTLLEQRQGTQTFAPLLLAAMRQAHRKVRADLAHSISSSQGADSMLKRKADVLPSAAASPTDAAQPSPAAPSEARQSFLYPGAPPSAEAAYLSQFMTVAGGAAQRYKSMSFDLLHLEPGMQVLDVGCGLGEDLPALAERVGGDGLVVGVDHDQDRFQAAHAAHKERGNVRVVISSAEHLPFAHRSFDGVRADRLLQYVPEPEVAVAEMWRVLRPGGMVTLIEPDWQAIALFPASPTGGDDDHTLHAIFQKTCAHPLIGRRLYSLLNQSDAAWEQVEMRVETFIITSWAEADAILVLSKTAQALAEAEPNLAEDINAWLKFVEAATDRGNFFASMPLFFASARKAASSR